MKILLSAYACEPGCGSEPGVGWNWVRHLARLEEVWVITRANNRAPIEAALAEEPLPRAHFVFFDLPRWLRFWKKGSRGLRLYYYLWQLGAWLRVRRLHRRVGFDVVHHVTFVKYWMPSFLALLPAPFVWGPVGGGESAPGPFWRSFRWRGKIYELARDTARRLGALDPFVRLTARRCILAMATTTQTARQLAPLGARRVVLCPESGLTAREMEQLGSLPPRRGGPFRVVSVGGLIHLKAFDLSLRAFARLIRECAASEYWLIGGGPERAHLERLAGELGVAEQVTFWGGLPRTAVLDKLADCDVLVHPTLHDSGGWVCLEAMAAGLPVVCLDLGGPGMQVTEQTGIKVPAISPEQAVRDLAAAFRKLHSDAALRARMGEAGRRRVAEHFAWPTKARHMVEVYRQACASGVIREREHLSRQAWWSQS